MPEPLPPQPPPAPGPDTTIFAAGDSTHALGNPSPAPPPTHPTHPCPAVIRPVRAADAPSVMELFRDGSLADQTHHGSTARDLQDLERHYIHNDDAWLWVAHKEQDDSALLGMIAVRIVGDDIAELCRLRVGKPFRKQGIGRALVEHALQHCRQQAFLKVVLDTFVERHAAIALFEQFGFRHARSRDSEGHPVMDFYLDLYSDCSPPAGSDNTTTP